MSIMGAQKEVIVIWVFSTSACQGHLGSLIELAVKMKDAPTVLLVTIASGELRISNYFHALEAATARLRLEYLQNVLKVLIMMNYLENLRQTANSVQWEESVHRLPRIKVVLVKKDTFVLLAPTLNSGPVLRALLVATGQD